MLHKIFGAFSEDGGNSIENDWPGEPSDKYWRQQLDEAEQELRQVTYRIIPLVSFDFYNHVICYIGISNFRNVFKPQVLF